MGVRGLLSYVLRHQETLQQVDLAQEARHGRHGHTAALWCGKWWGNGETDGEVFFTLYRKYGWWFFGSSGVPHCISLLIIVGEVAHIHSEICFVFDRCYDWLLRHVGCMETDTAFRVSFWLRNPWCIDSGSHGWESWDSMVFFDVGNSLFILTGLYINVCGLDYHSSIGGFIGHIFGIPGFTEQSN